MIRVTIEDLHRMMGEQNVSSREHIAVKCPICSTVQSIASLRKAGVPEDEVEDAVGYSCEGRWTKAGPHVMASSISKRGCDWTLGGFLKAHKMEFITDEGVVHPTFELASPEEAQALEAHMLAGQTETAETS